MLIGRAGDAGTVLTELTGVAGNPSHRHPVNDQTATDAAGATVEIDDVVESPRRAVEVLGDGSEGRVVVDGRGQPGRVGDEFPDRCIVPFEVGGGAHQAVPRADEPGNRDPDADDAAPCECGLLPRSDRVGHESRSLAGSDEFGALDPEPGGDRLVEGYRRDRHGIHLGVHGDRDDPGIGGDDRRRAADAPRGIGGGLCYEARRAQFGNEIGDRRTVESRREGQSCPRPRAFEVDLPENASEIAGPDAVGSRLEHAFTVGDSGGIRRGIGLF